MPKKHEEIIDYAMPLMKIERYAKLAHDACLKQDYKEAEYHALQLATEARIFNNTLKLMKEQELCRSQSGSN
jgi:hypothetical protein